MSNLSLDFLFNQSIANLQILYTKLHCYHWYVKGSMFIPLHAKFESLYDMVTSHYDSFAERLLMIGHKPIFTLKDALATATIKEALGTESADQMIGQIISDFTVLVEEMQHLAQAADAKEDMISADLAISLSAQLQKEIWILRSITN